MKGLPAASAESRASRISRATISMRVCASSACEKLFSMRSNGAPLSMRSPSRTRMSATIPPSKCCTVWFCDCGTTLPAPRVTLSSEVMLAQATSAATPSAVVATKAFSARPAILSHCRG